MTAAGNAPVVIVGSGLAGLSFASSLRHGGYTGELTLVSDEAEAPYDRPPLSKAFLKDGDAQRIRLDESRLTEARVLRGLRAQALDLVGRTLTLADGQKISWGTLVLATGAHPRELPKLDAIGKPVLTLRTLNDARRLRELIQPGRHLLLVGAGVIGLELAATAREAGCAVTVVESQARVMSRSAPPTLSDYVHRRHLRAGVDLRLGRFVDRCVEGEAVLDDGSRIAADFVVAGIGVKSNDDLARAVGIRCEDGVHVDGHGRTSAPGVLAVGDVAKQVDPISGQVMRIETWSNAQMQAAAAARSWLNPEAPPYTDAPWYWSDQYDLRIQAVGLACGEREVVRGDMRDGKFALLQFQGRTLVGAACMNSGKDFGSLRKLVGRSFEADDAQWAAASDLRKMN
jgi:3-phenylpropionate/trans-cinnamate dioxygenase ferredoxin reductase subunit